MYTYICANLERITYYYSYVTYSEKKAYEFLYNEMEMFIDDIIDTQCDSELYDMEGNEIDWHDLPAQYKSAKGNYKWIDYYASEIHEYLFPKDMGNFFMIKNIPFEEIIEQYIKLEDVTNALREKILCYKTLQSEIIHDLNKEWIKE